MDKECISTSAALVAIVQYKIKIEASLFLRLFDWSLQFLYSGGQLLHRSIRAAGASQFEGCPIF